MANDLSRKVTQDPRGVHVVHYIDGEGTDHPKTVDQRYLCASSSENDVHEMGGNDLCVYIGNASGIAPMRPVSLARLGILIRRECDRIEQEDRKRVSEQIERERKAREALDAITAPRRVEEADLSPRPIGGGSK